MPQSGSGQLLSGQAGVQAVWMGALQMMAQVAAAGWSVGGGMAAPRACGATPRRLQAGGVATSPQMMMAATRCL